jgi:hypothetical protein
MNFHLGFDDHPVADARAEQSQHETFESRGHRQRGEEHATFAEVPERFREPRPSPIESARTVKQIVPYNGLRHNVAVAANVSVAITILAPRKE